MSEGFQGQYEPTPQDKKDAIEGKATPIGKLEPLGTKEAREALMKRVRPGTRDSNGENRIS